jgi:hypothetical protein
MSRIVRVAATSMATLEASAPPFNQRAPDPEENLKLGLSMLEAAGNRRRRDSRFGGQGVRYRFWPSGTRDLLRSQLAGPVAGIGGEGRRSGLPDLGLRGRVPPPGLRWQHQFPIVTSVWSYHAKVIERTGRVAAATSRWGRIATLDLNLDKQLFHTDCHAHVLVQMQERYGNRIRIETFTKEHLFTLESLDPQLSVGDIVSEFGLTDYRAYIERSARKQRVARPSMARAAQQRELADG